MSGPSKQPSKRQYSGARACQRRKAIWGGRRAAGEDVDDPSASTAPVALPRATLLGLLLATLWLADVAPLWAQGLDRLFTTVEQRQQLDLARQEAATASPTEATPKKTAQVRPTAPPIGSLTVNGVVLRSSGHNTSWVNGDQVAPGGRTPDGLVVEQSARGTRIRLPSGIDTVELAPGQKIDVSSGVVLEAYEQTVTDAAGSAFEFDKGGQSAGQERVGQGDDERSAPGSEPQTAQVPTVRSLEAQTPSALDTLRRLLDRALGEQ